MMRRPDIFSEPSSFIPERHIASPPNPLAIPRNAWRPFEKGPRSCIGETMAMIQTEVILVMLLGKFDFEKIWRGCQQVEGEKLYQNFGVTSKPKDGMPVRCRLRM